MKAKIEKKEKAFTPFKVKLEIETIQEARLLFHVFNNRNIGEGIVNEEYDMGYSKDYAKDFGTDMFAELESLITGQGFKL